MSKSFKMSFFIKRKRFKTSRGHRNPVFYKFQCKILTFGGFVFVLKYSFYLLLKSETVTRQMAKKKIK